MVKQIAYSYKIKAAIYTASGINTKAINIMANDAADAHEKATAQLLATWKKTPQDNVQIEILAALREQ